MLFCVWVVPSTVAQQAAASSRSLQDFAADFWAWRARFEPFSADDIPRMERPAGHRDWSLDSIRSQRAALKDYEARWQRLDRSGWSVPDQVDDRLMGSAMARVRWELDVNRRWERDPTFYVNQTLTALLESLLPPPPFDATRSREILARMQEIPQILEAARANLRPLRPFAQLAITSLDQIRPKLLRVQTDVAPMFKGTGASDDQAGELAQATQQAVAALEAFREWLQARLSTMPQETAIGRQGYEFFLRDVALLPYSPEQLLAISRQEWDRAVSFEQYEKQRNRGMPELRLAATLDEEIENAKRSELAIRRFLQEKNVLTVPADIPHYTLRPMPGYLQALSDFGELDDFTGPSRLNHDCVRWAESPSPQLGYFWLATAKDPRPITVHEGIPGHYFQLSLSWRHPDPIRRHYYDSGANEGIGFYAEEMMLQAGLFDDSPRTREIVYNFMRLRALRVEVDVKLALGSFTIAQAAEYLSTHVPMDKNTATQEAAAFATAPGQAISYQIGKSQIMRFLADSRLAQREKFDLQAFHNFVWTNGNVPIALQRWEYLGKDDDSMAVTKSPNRDY